MNPKNYWADFAKAFIVATFGGWVFTYIYVPLPWMLGPMIAVFIFQNIFKQKAQWPLRFRNTGLLVMGFIMGGSFTPETGHQIIAQLPAMFLSTALSLLVCLWMGWIVHQRTRISLASGMMGSIPGGLSQMVILSEELPAANMTVVTFMQTIRILAVVFVVPSIAIYGLAGPQASVGTVTRVAAAAIAAPDTIIYALAAAAGTWLAVRLNLPTALLLGPLLGTAPLGLTGFAAPHLPQTVIIFSQIAMGGYMGYKMDPESLRAAPGLLYWSFFLAIGAVLFSLGLGYVIDSTVPIGLVTAFLATAPGGMAEMALTAAATNSDVAIVTAYQTFRLLFILFVTPPILRRWFGEAE